MLPQPLAVAVFASGRGSNLQALHQAATAGDLPIHIVGVFSDKANSGALAYAQAQGLFATSFCAKDFPSREAFDTTLMQAAGTVSPGLIICAGYMRIISKAGLAAAPCLMINIHPSLLPKYPGLDTHARAIAAGDREHGASVHLVNDVLDGGRILAQVRVPIQPGDSPNALAERVLSQEHSILIETVRAICSGEITL